MKKVSILGCGWLGMGLANALLQQGYLVKGSTTTKSRLKVLSGAGIESYLLCLDEYFNYNQHANFFDCDVLILSSNTRISGTGYLNALKEITKNTVAFKVIVISSTSVYEDCNAVVDELTRPNPKKETARLLIEAESIFYKKHLSTTIIRFGGLVGPGRMPGKFFSGKSDNPNGMAPVNLIHLQDCIGIMEAAIQKAIPSMVINAVSPHHPTKANFYLRAAIAGNLPVPTFKMELNQWKIVYSINVGKYLDYKFKVDNWLTWLKAQQQTG